MREDTLATMDQFHRRLGEPDLQRLADQAMRDRVVPMIDLDVIVEIDLDFFPNGMLVASFRQWPQGRLLIGKPGHTAAVGLLEWSLIQRGQRCGQDPIERGQREEGLVSQRRHARASSVN